MIGRQTRKRPRIVPPKLAKRPDPMRHVRGRIARAITGRGDAIVRADPAAAVRRIKWGRP